ncbi:MAG: prepilin-type N-terminal cleavage/methylation domain-containing protein [Planctomycetota bacterium]|jgi:prepilin-type N-terminal cleavage/methylation domain-containing protein
MKFPNSRGFTLVELLVTISIIILLAALVTVGVSSARKKSRKGVTQAEISNLELALKMYYETYGEYPAGDGNGPKVKGNPTARVDSGNANMVSALTGEDEETEGDKFWKTKERNLRPSVSVSGKQVVVDAWGIPYIYRSAYDENNNAREGVHNEDSFDIYSCGPNMVDDNGEKDDITNW